MGKISVHNQISESVNFGTPIEQKAVYDIIQSKFQLGDVIGLCLGPQGVETFDGHEYAVHRILHFVGEFSALAETMPKSAHSFSFIAPAYNEQGEVLPKPKCGVKTSKKGHQCPTLDFIDQPTVFRFYTTRIDSGDDRELVLTSVQVVQWAKVTGFRYYYVPKWDPTGDVVTIDDPEEGQVCDFKVIRKPVFQIVTPTQAQITCMNDYLKANNLLTD